ncbi:MAG: PfkB family carbohydrate kinase, partial [bacterium]
DLAAEASDFLHSLGSVDVEPGVRVVAEPNNRVQLRYRAGVRVGERLSGGVPPWRWAELAPLVTDCDAIYVNFISGFEMELETVQELRSRFAGPIYADLHSLFLGIGREGERIPQPLPHWAEWLRSFDAVQMNEDEFHLLARREGDPWALAARAVGPDLKLTTITMGERGAAYVAAADFEPDPFAWDVARARMASTGPARSGRVPTTGPAADGDPTGCGDVWGSTTFARHLAGDSLEHAMKTANRMAARNVEHRGARGLGLHLRGRIATGGNDS